MLKNGTCGCYPSHVEEKNATRLCDGVPHGYVTVRYLATGFTLPCQKGDVPDADNADAASFYGQAIRVVRAGRQPVSLNG